MEHRAKGGDYKIAIPFKDKNGVRIPLPLLEDYVISIYRLCGGKKELLFFFRKGATGISATKRFGESI